MTIAAVGCSTTSGTGEAGEDEDGAPTLDANFYPAAVSEICASTDERLAELPSPGDGISETDWASEVGMALDAEAESLGDVGTISTVREDHRTFVTNTRDQAAQWNALSEAIAAGDATGIDAARTEILELSRGRIELAAELGIGGCRERTFG
ncbi:MAG: hypothetical protein ABJH68_03735 [Ilumatobacter sp.]